MRLHEFIATNFQQIREEWLRRLRESFAPESMPAPELYNSLPVFLSDIVDTLASWAEGTKAAEKPSGLPTKSLIAKEHGEQRLRLGFDASSLVREYFTLRQCAIDLAREAEVEIWFEEEEILTHCISAGITEAILEYRNQRDQMFHKLAARHVGFLAHELRNALSASNLALSTLENSYPIAASRSFQILRRNLERVEKLVDSALVDASLKAKAELQREEVDLRAISQELVAESAAEEKRVAVSVDFDHISQVQGDRRLLHSALANLIHNAVKFTREGGTVRVRGRAADGRLVIDVEDECGGLPEGKLETLFDPFVQSTRDRSGFGLGLAIAKQAVEAHTGAIRVHNIPGKGCIFSLDLPRETA